MKAEMFKDRVSYYDMDELTAKMYKPIDDFLGLTKRYNPKALKSSYRTALIGLYLLIIPLAAIELFVIFFGLLLLALLFGGILAGYVKLLMTVKKNQWKKVPDDILSCENIIDSDSMENVFHDFDNAKNFGTKNVLIGNKYLFIKNATVIRLKDIVKTDMRIEEGDEDSTSLYFYQIYVKDEVGERVYELRLNNNDPHGAFNMLNALLKKQEETLGIEVKGEIKALPDNFLVPFPDLQGQEISSKEKEYVYR